MTSTAARASQTARSDADQFAAPAARTTVSASCGAPTTSREPLSQWTTADAWHSARDGRPAGIRTPAASRAARSASGFAAVGLATRIPELARWIAARPSFTFAEAAAASAPSPCSLTVMAYTLPDPRLAAALAELGYVVTAGGKNGYTVTALDPRAAPDATSPATPTAS
jgi:hypothetical protein